MPVTPDAQKCQVARQLILALFGSPDLLRSCQRLISLVLKSLWPTANVNKVWHRARISRTHRPKSHETRGQERHASDRNPQPPGPRHLDPGRTARRTGGRRTYLILEATTRPAPWPKVGGRSGRCDLRRGTRRKSANAKNEARAQVRRARGFN